jgi:hypothetical protein
MVQPIGEVVMSCLGFVSGLDEAFDLAVAADEAFA